MDAGGTATPRLSPQSGHAVSDSRPDGPARLAACHRAQAAEGRTRVSPDAERACRSRSDPAFPRRTLARGRRPHTETPLDAWRRSWRAQIGRQNPVDANPKQTVIERTISVCQRLYLLRLRNAYTVHDATHEREAETGATVRRASVAPDPRRTDPGGGANAASTATHRLHLRSSRAVRPRSLSDRSCGTGTDQRIRRKPQRRAIGLPAEARFAVAVEPRHHQQHLRPGPPAIGAPGDVRTRPAVGLGRECVGERGWRAVFVGAGRFRPSPRNRLGRGSRRRPRARR